MLNAAASADPYHSAVGLTGDHWEPKDSLCYEDENGPIFAVRTRNVVRCDIQFLSQDVERNARAVISGFYQYIRILQNRGVTEIIFNTNSPAVENFFIKRFHFRKVSEGTFSLAIG